MHHADGTWTWDHRDATGNELAKCRKPFRHFQECLFDARNHGYRDPGSGATTQFSCFF